MEFKRNHEELERASGRPIKGRQMSPTSEGRIPSTSGSQVGGSEQFHRKRGNPLSMRPISKVECSFCKKNGETRSFYSTHVVRDRFTGNVICPILRKHVCEVCGATGDNSHTRSYCPQGSAPNMAALKMTPRNSTSQRNAV
ncbi:nanos homolog 3-like [Ornithodoros turicata]|uniref:nanos homolog 3-like n=1 Tax=Ornithodoros turicata TaxID=34597 RepID=UPI00313950DC